MSGSFNPIQRLHIPSTNESGVFWYNGMAEEISNKNILKDLPALLRRSFAKVQQAGVVFGKRHPIAIGFKMHLFYCNAVSIIL